MGILNYDFGDFKKGKLNKITDVSGVMVGHSTIKSDKHKTGVTSIIPNKDTYNNKLEAGLTVFNGYGKSAGLMQVEELGNIETPLLLTNTFAVGRVLDCSVQYMVEHYPDLGTTAGGPNNIVMECNDFRINYARDISIEKKHVYEAIDTASSDFDEGAVGAGTGMVCMGLKGGIGSASRIINIKDREYTLGALVLSNFGLVKHLRIEDNFIGKKMYEAFKNQREEKDKGSIIMVIATDIPADSRQLKRISARAAVGLSRVGSYLGHGSGDIALAFSTTYNATERISDDDLENAFIATADCIEESVISSLFHAETTESYNGRIFYSLKDNLKNLNLSL
ncbi:peptidase family T4 [Peptoniphilus sp. ING2-D1G]|nr:peptidase family T4 [Peptoniphilus sp. ING2-D1G]